MSFYCQFQTLSILVVISHLLFLGFMPSELTNHHEEGFEFGGVPWGKFCKEAVLNWTPSVPFC